MEKKDKIDELAIRLLEKETLALPDIVDILGPRPYPLKQSLLEYMEELKQRATDDEAAEQAKKEA